MVFVEISVVVSEFMNRSEVCLGASEEGCCSRGVIMLVSNDLFWAADVIRVCGPRLEVDIRTQQQEQWNIVRVRIFVIIGYSLLLVGDSWCGMGDLVFSKGFMDVIAVNRLS